MSDENKDSTLTKTLNSAVQGLVDRLEKTETFVVEQAPEICKQMIYEKLIKVWAAIIPSAFLVVISLFLIPYFFKNSSFRDDATVLQSLCGLGLLGFVVGSVVCSILLFENLQQLFFLKKCPKLFLLREFKNLVK